MRAVALGIMADVFVPVLLNLMGRGLGEKGVSRTGWKVGREGEGCRGLGGEGMGRGEVGWGNYCW